MQLGKFLFLGAVALVGCALEVRSTQAADSELSTDAEKSYLTLRASTDASRKALADRWYNLVQLQDWVDATGKFTTKAKYLDHDPQLAWVKLRVVKGTGKDRVVKDLTIPVEKLDKTGQSRVRQISVLKEKVAAAIVADEEAKKKAKEKDGSGHEMAEPAATESHEPEASGRESTDPRRGQGETVEQASPAADTSTGGPLPAAFPPLPNDAGTATNPAALPTDSAAAPVGMEERDGRPGPLPPMRGATARPEQSVDPATALATPPPLNPNLPLMPDSDPWRTSYEAFQSAFERDEHGIVSTRQRWPGVINLQLFTPEEFLRTPQGGETPTNYVAVPRLIEVGDFVWEGTLDTDPTGDGNWANVLGLVPLPEPIKLELKLDDEGRSGTWQRFRQGDHVRFVGRFTGYKGPYTWVAAIRLFDEPGPAGNATPGSEPR